MRGSLSIPWTSIDSPNCVLEDVGLFFFFPNRELSAGLLELCCVEDQTSHATHIKEHALASIYKTKEYLLANRAARH